MNLSLLTPKEREVLRWFREGRAGIAQRLRIKVKTVDFHLQSIRDKLDCHGPTAKYELADMSRQVENGTGGK